MADGNDRVWSVRVPLREASRRNPECPGLGLDLPLYGSRGNDGNVPVPLGRLLAANEEPIAQISVFSARASASSTSIPR